jgi:outer membrane protein assembly factor BamB
VKTTNRLPRASIAGLISLACMVQTFAANWPEFRGPNGCGVAANEKPPVHFGPSSNVLWQAELSPGHSSPIIWDNAIFVTGAQGKTLYTLCFDRRDGKKRWEQAVTAEKAEPVHQMNSLATPTPVTDGHAVVAYFGSFGLLAYDLEGKEIWRKALPMPKTFRNQGTGTSPILAEGKLVLFVQLANDSHLLALDLKDGRELWRTPMPAFNMSYSTPVYWKETDKGCVGLCCADRFTAWRLADGKEAWWVAGLGYEACSTPVASGERLIIGVAGVQGEPANITVPPPFDEFIKQYDANKDGLITYSEIPADFIYTDRHNSDGQGNMTLRQALTWFGGMKQEDKVNRERWEEIRGKLREFSEHKINATMVASVRTGGSQDVTASNIVWKETKAVPEAPSPLVWDGRVYLIRSGGNLACRDLETGKLIYEKQTESRGGYFASPVVADGRIYLASDRGTVTVIKAGDAFEVLARNELNDRIMASPAIVENTLYIRSDKHLWAFAQPRP